MDVIRRKSTILFFTSPSSTKSLSPHPSPQTSATLPQVSIDNAVAPTRLSNGDKPDLFVGEGLNGIPLDCRDVRPSEPSHTLLPSHRLLAESPRERFCNTLLVAAAEAFSGNDADNPKSAIFSVFSSSSMPLSNPVLTFFFVGLVWMRRFLNTNEIAT